MTDLALTAVIYLSLVFVGLLIFAALLVGLLKLACWLYDRSEPLQMGATVDGPGYFTEADIEAAEAELAAGEEARFGWAADLTRQIRGLPSIEPWWRYADRWPR